MTRPATPSAHGDAGNVMSGNVAERHRDTSGRRRQPTVFAQPDRREALSTAAMGNSSRTASASRVRRPRLSVASAWRANVIGGNGQNGIGITAARPVSRGHVRSRRQHDRVTFAAQHRRQRTERHPPRVLDERHHRRRYAGRDEPDLVERAQRCDGALRQRQPDQRNNSIADNSILGIDLGNDGVTGERRRRRRHRPEQSPELPGADGDAAGVQGTLNSLANTPFSSVLRRTCLRRLWQRRRGTFLGAVTVNTDGSGNAAFRCRRARGPVRHRAPRPDAGNTSEFSACVIVPAARADGRPGADDDGLGGPGCPRHAVELCADGAERRAAAGGRCADHRHAAGRPDRDGRLGLPGRLHDRDELGDVQHRHAGR